MAMDLFSEAFKVEANKLFAIVLGSSGSGKSRVCGTLPGKTLYLFFQGERHGPSSALAGGGDLIPVCIDRGRDGQDLTADQAFKRGLECLDPEVLKKAKIENIVLDGLTELEKCVRETKAWKIACESASGKHNNFQEPAATLNLIDKYMSALRRAQDTVGVNVVVTGIIDVQEIEDNGAIGTAKPRLSGYSVAEGCIQQFGDVLVIGRLVSPDGKSAHVFQTGADITRISKDDEGKVKKFINFTPRISGVSELPAFIKADLKNVLTMKEKK